MSVGIDCYAREGAQSARAILVEAAHAAGRIATRFFRRGRQTVAKIETKDNGSPVTEADILCDQFLARELRPRFPDAGWLSEELADDLERLEKRTLVLVDPIDGTRGFVAGDPRWTVCIALVVDGRPLAAVVHAPALDETYAAALGSGATLNGLPISTSRRTVLCGARAAGPKELAGTIALGGTSLAMVPKVPSLAYRLVSVASGALDVAFASSDAHDWDIAAADLVVHEAGGMMTYVDGSVPRYNARATRHGILVAAPQPIHGPLRDAVAGGLRAAETSR